MRSSLLLVLLPIALLAACKRADDTASIAPAATAAAPATVQAAPGATVAAPAGVSESPAPGEHTTFDAKAFAGTFASEDMTIRFTADGAYTRSSHGGNSTGTWTLEPDGRHIRLDPTIKDEADKVYEVVSNDELHAAGGPQVLRREGGAAQQ